jgi:hypothetical protein
VYWRRRLAVAAALIALLAITVYELWPSGSKHATTAARITANSSHASAPRAVATATSSAPAPAVPAPAGSPVQSSPAAASAPAPCDPTKLQLAATTAASTFAVGDTPTLYLQVTNPGPAPCVVDLSDKKILMQVYNGQSRVWGSHDCQIQSGSNLKTLAVSVPVRVGVQWSGLSSQPQCAGTRQRVVGGVYTLYVQLAGVDGKAATFTIT